MAVSINIDRIEELRVWELLETSGMGYSLEDIPRIDVTLIGLKQSFWEIEKGRRIHRCYYLPDTPTEDCVEENCVIKFEYDYHFNSNGQIDSYVVTIQYIDLNGDIGIEKTIDKILSPTYIIALNRKVREGQIDNLRGRGEDLRNLAETLDEPAKSNYINVANAVDSLWVYYRDEINEYINVGDTVFKNAVENEADPTITGILGIVVSSDGVTTVQDTILSEIN